MTHDDTESRQTTNPYYTDPETIDVRDDLREVVETLAGDCAGAIRVFGPRHARYYDTRDTIHPRALNHVADAGGHFTAVESLPAPDQDRDDLTWYGSDLHSGESVACFEFWMPHHPGATVEIDRQTALVAHEAVDQAIENSTAATWIDKLGTAGVVLAESVDREPGHFIREAIPDDELPEKAAHESEQ